MTSQFITDSASSGMFLHWGLVIVFVTWTRQLINAARAMMKKNWQRLWDDKWVLFYAQITWKLQQLIEVYYR